MLPPPPPPPSPPSPPATGCSLSGKRTVFLLARQRNARRRRRAAAAGADGQLHRRVGGAARGLDSVRGSHGWRRALVQRGEAGSGDAACDGQHGRLLLLGRRFPSMEPRAAAGNGAEYSSGAFGGAAGRRGVVSGGSSAQHGQPAQQTTAGGRDDRHAPDSELNGGGEYPSLRERRGASRGGRALLYLTYPYEYFGQGARRPAKTAAEPTRHPAITASALNGTVRASCSAGWPASG